MALLVTRQIEQPMDWSAMLANREVQSNILGLSRGEAGMVLLSHSGRAEFVSAADLVSADTTGLPDEAELQACFAKAQSIAKRSYDPLTDLVVGFRNNDGPVEKLAGTGKTARVRAWWIKPLKRGHRRINLSEPDEVVAHLAFEL